MSFLKVLQINSHFTEGGPPNVVNGINSILYENQIHGFIASSRGHNDNKKNSIKVGNKFHNLFNALKSRIFDNEGLNANFSTKILIKKIKKINPNIIHLHNIHGYYLNYEKLFDFLNNSNYKLVWTLHDCWAFTGHCTHFDFIGCSKWQIECKNCPQIKEYPKSWFLDNSYNNFHKKKIHFTKKNNITIVTPSNWLKRMVQQSFLKNNDVKVINNGIDLNIFKPTLTNFRKKYNLEKEFIILGVASFWRQKKGLDTFIKLSKEIPKNVKILLIGIIDNKKDLNNNIIILDNINDKRKLASIYTTSDLFLNPTLEDNFPTTNIEALACGTPVVTYDSGGSKEMLNNECGIYIERNNYLKLKNTIIKIINNNPFCKNKCIEKAKNYDLKDKFIEYVQLYKKIIN